MSLEATELEVTRYGRHRKPAHMVAEGRKCPVDPGSRKRESRAPGARLECAPQESTGPQLFLTPHPVPKGPTQGSNLFAAVQRGLSQALRVLSVLFGVDLSLLPNAHWGLWGKLDLREAFAPKSLSTCDRIHSAGSRDPWWEGRVQGSRLPPGLSTPLEAWARPLSGMKPSSAGVRPRMEACA